MRQNNRLSWSLALAIGIPVLALTGCPGLVGGTSPTPTPTTAASAAASTAPTATPVPTPTPTPTPALRKTTVLTKVNIPATGSRTITIKNLDSVAKDLTNWALSFEYKDTTGKNMVHARIASGSTNATMSLAAGAELVISESTTGTDAHIKLDSTIGGATGVDKLGIQATHGSVVIYKGATAQADLTSANLVDYVQYGNISQSSDTSNWTHAQAAVDAKVWESLTATASAPGTSGKAIKVTTAGASGSANWVVE